MRSKTLVVAIGGSLLWFATAAASSSLKDTPTLSAAAKGIGPAVASKHFAKKGVSDLCADNLLAPGLVGLQCRAIAVAAELEAKPPGKRDGVLACIALARDLSQSARDIRTYEPLSPEPGYRVRQFEAHRATSSALMLILDQLNALPPSHPGIADARKATPALKTAACEAVARSIDLGTGADLPLPERGQLQGLITGHRCFLDDSKLVKEKRPELLANNDTANALKNAVGDAGAIRQYAESRAIELDRCVDKHTNTVGRINDAKKLETCACGVFGRFKFPARPTETAAALPVGKVAEVDVVVAPAGAVFTCGGIREKP